MQIPEINQNLPEAPKENPIVPDPNYTPPLMVTSKRAKKEVASHLDFLQKLTNL
jgi:hypothetical protein